MKYWYYVVLLVLLSACSNDEAEKPTLTKRVSFSCNFEVNDFQKSRASISECVTNLYLYDVVNGKISYDFIQKVGETNFGTMSCDLKYGSHTLYFVGTNSDIVSFNDSIAKFNKVTDTFIYSLTIDVNKETASKLDVTLSRCVSKIEIQAIDKVPEDACSIDVSINNYYNEINLNTGNSVLKPSSTIKSFNYSENQKGMSDTEYSIYSFVPVEKSDIAVDIDIKDKDGDVIYSRSFDEIEVYKNKILHYSGNLFLPKSTNINIPFAIDSDWDETIKLDY